MVGNALGELGFLATVKMMGSQNSLDQSQVGVITIMDASIGLASTGPCLVGSVRMASRGRCS